VVPDVRTRGARLADAVAPSLAFAGWLAALVALVVVGVLWRDCEFRWRHERLYPADTYQPRPDTGR
jgi:hypothetical protein